MKRARRSGLFCVALEEGSSQAVKQLLLLSAGHLFLRGFLLCSFLLCGFLLGLALGRLLLGFAFCGLLLGYLFLRLFLRLLLGYLFLGLFLRLLLGYLFLRYFLFGFFLGRFFLGFALGDLFLGLFLRYFFLRLFLGDLFLCYAFFRRCLFLCRYFPLLGDFSLRSFLTSFLFGSHAFLRVGYPQLSIYNKTKKSSKRLACPVP